MKSLIALIAVTIAAASIAAPAARAQTREEWIALGTRVHGGFGAFMPIGIRIGLDALERLKAQPRDVTVVYHDSDKSPCACIADGIMIATAASPGQRTLHISAEKAPDGLLAAAVVRHKRTGEAVRYAVSHDWLLKVGGWNRSLDPAGRYDEVMKAEALFEVTPVK